MEEVRAHLDDTYFALDRRARRADSVFYYRIHSPVILIEFDHQTPVALPGPKEANRQHIHTVVRTPNGNDYGKDLLRQHYEKHKTRPGARAPSAALGRGAHFNVTRFRSSVFDSPSPSMTGVACLASSSK